MSGAMSMNMTTSLYQEPNYVMYPDLNNMDIKITVAKSELNKALLNGNASSKEALFVRALESTHFITGNTSSDRINEETIIKAQLLGGIIDSGYEMTVKEFVDMYMHASENDEPVANYAEKFEEILASYRIQY